jgi:hypothetical protein
VATGRAVLGRPGRAARRALKSGSPGAGGGGSAARADGGRRTGRGRSYDQDQVARSKKGAIPGTASAVPTSASAPSRGRSSARANARAIRRSTRRAPCWTPGSRPMTDAAEGEALYRRLARLAALPYVGNGRVYGAQSGRDEDRRRRNVEQSRRLQRLSPPLPALASRRRGAHSRPPRRSASLPSSTSWASTTCAIARPRGWLRFVNCRSVSSERRQGSAQVMSGQTVVEKLCADLDEAGHRAVHGYGVGANVCARRRA